MKPSDLALFRSYGRPAIVGAGTVLAALSTPDVGADLYRSVLHRLREAVPAVQLTRGPRDSAPVVSPNGAVVVFLRAGRSGPAQLYAMPLDGGEPFQLAHHPLGASSVRFAPDGRTIAYLAAVPEPGRYGTTTTDGDGRPASSTGVSDGRRYRPQTADGDSADSGAAPTADEEAPRRITSLSYRTDGRGFTGDRREQIFVLELIGPDGSALPDSAPRQLTGESVAISGPAFTPDGRQLVYSRAVSVDSVRSEIAVIAVDRDEPGRGLAVVTPIGDATAPVVVGQTLFYVGAEFDGIDFAGRTPGLWAVPFAGGTPRRLTDPETVHVDGDVGEPAAWHDDMLVAVLDRGSVSLRAVPIDADRADLRSLPVVLGGRRVVSSFQVSGEQVAAVVGDPSSCGDVVMGDIGSLISAHAPVGHDVTTAGGSRLTDVSAPLRGAGIAAPIEITGSAPDGYPVHGWLMLPPARFPAPHPVLLNVHGGPHGAYGWAVFDEAQMYTARGYAVVLPNPRGSAGYGQTHGRALLGALGVKDADDVLAVLDAALTRDDLDAGRVGVMGGSYGGFMTSWLASHAPGRFVAGVSERAVNSWDSLAGTSDIGYFFVEAYAGSDPKELRAKSPLEFADRITMPLLIIHSEQDWRCPVEQAQRLFVALKSRGHETEMLLFPGEGHELSRSGRPKHRVARFEAILDWWSRHLPVGETAGEPAPVRETAGEPAPAG